MNENNYSGFDGFKIFNDDYLGFVEYYQMKKQNSENQNINDQFYNKCLREWNNMDPKDKERYIITVKMQRKQKKEYFNDYLFQFENYCRSIRKKSPLKQPIDYLYFTYDQQKDFQNMNDSPKRVLKLGKVPQIREIEKQMMQRIALKNDQFKREEKYMQIDQQQFFDVYIPSKDNLIYEDRLYYGERINITFGEIVDYSFLLDPSDFNNYVSFLSIINNTYYVSEVEYYKFPWFSNQSEIYQQSIPELTQYLDNKHICSKIIYMDDSILISCQIETTPESFENFFIKLDADGSVTVTQAPGLNEQPLSQLQYWPITKILSQIQNGDITNFDDRLDVVNILNFNNSIISMKNVSSYEIILTANQLIIQNSQNKTIIENITCKGKPKDVGGHLANLYVACDQLYNFGFDTYIDLNVSKIQTTEYYLILDNKYILDTITNQYFTSQYPIYAAGYGDYAVVVKQDGLYPVIINDLSIFSPTAELTLNDLVTFYPVDQGLMALNTTQVFDKITLSYGDVVYGPLPEIDQKSGLGAQFPIKKVQFENLTNIKAAIQSDEGLRALNQDKNNDLVLVACTLDFECGSQTIIDQNVNNVSQAQFYIDDDDDVLYLAYIDNNEVKLYKNSQTKTILSQNQSNIAFDSNLLAIYKNNTLLIYYVDENAEYVGLNMTYQNSIKQLVIDDYEVYVIFDKYYYLYDLSYEDYIDFIDAETHGIQNITFAHAQDGQLILFNETSFQQLYDGYERGVYQFNFTGKSFQRTDQFVYIYDSKQLIIMDPDMSQSLTGQLTYIARWNTSSDSIFVENDDDPYLISNGSIYFINLDIQFIPTSANFSADYYYKTQNITINFTNILNQSVKSELKFSSPAIPVQSKGKLTVNITNGTGSFYVRDAFYGNVKYVKSLNPNITVKYLYQEVKQFDNQTRDILTISNQSLILFDKNITILNKSLQINITCQQLEAYLSGFLIICQNVTIYFHSIDLSNFTLHNLSLSKQEYKIHQQYIGLLDNKSLTIRNLTNEFSTIKDVDSYTFDGSEVVVLRKNELSVCDFNLKCSQVFNLSTFGFEYNLISTYKNKTYFIFTPLGINHLIKLDQEIQVLKSFSGSYQSVPFEIHVYGDMLQVCYFDQQQVVAYFYDITTNSSVIPYIDSLDIESEYKCGKEYYNNSFLLKYKDSKTSDQFIVQYSVQNKMQITIHQQGIKSFNIQALGDVTLSQTPVQLNYLSSTQVVIPKEKTSDDLILTILTILVVLIVVILFIRQVRKYYLIRKMNQAGQAKPSEFNSEYL